MSRLLQILALAVFSLLMANHGARASVHDIHLHTDSTPDLVSIEDLTATLTSGWDDPEDQAIAFWNWMVSCHLQSSATFEDGRPLWDPIEFYGSYPNSFCGYTAAFLTAFVDAMGGDWRHRYVELSDHTVCEISWDAGGTWHMFDVSMVIYTRNHDGSIASCADISEPGICALSQFWGSDLAEPGHLYLYHGAAESVTNPPDPDQVNDLGYPSGYRKACENPVPFSRTLRNGADSYLTGFDVQESFTHVRTGWVNRLQLHPGHTYTRHWQPFGAGAEFARVNSRGEDPNDAYYPANIRSNGLWEIQPGFSTTDISEGWYDLPGLVHRNQDGGQGPVFRPAAGMDLAELIVKVDAAGVLTSARVYLDGQRGAGDLLNLEISRDAGCTWVVAATPAAGSFSNWFELDSELVGGVHELLVKVRLQPDSTRLDCGINDLRIEAITQLNRMTLPTLQRGNNRVRFQAGSPRETLTLRPTLHAGAEHHWTMSAESHTGLTSRDDYLGYATAIVVPTEANIPGSATWRFDVPTDLLGFQFGGSFLTRAGGAGNEVRLLYSWDGVDFHTAEIFDSSTAPTWDARLFAEPSFVPPAQRSVWLQYEAHSSVAASPQSTGLQDVLLKVQYEAHDPAFTPVAVTWCWTEHRPDGDITRQHTQVVTGPEDGWDINVAGYRDPTMQWVRVGLAGMGQTEGYSDGTDVGPNHGYDKKKITSSWLNDIALHRPYTVSRPSVAGNPDTGGAELTNGVVLPPTTYATSSLVQGQVAYWEGDDPLTVIVDLGEEQLVQAIRVTSHQPDEYFAHAGTIEAFAITDDHSVSSVGVIQHDDVFSPPGDHLDWGYWRSEDFSELPAEGRLAHGYWLVLDEPTLATEIRLEVLPLAGYGVGLSEVQIFSEISVTDWPDRRIDLGGSLVSVSPEQGPTLWSSGTLKIFPNPANPGTTISYDLPRGTRVTLRVVDIRGRVVRTLVDGWRPAGSHRAFWDGRDVTGRFVASGHYLAVSEADGRRGIGSITLVR